MKIPPSSGFSIATLERLLKSIEKETVKQKSFKDFSEMHEYVQTLEYVIEYFKDSRNLCYNHTNGNSYVCVDPFTRVLTV